MSNPKEYTFSADHVCAEYTFDRATVRVDEYAQSGDKPALYYATKPGLGCGKNAETPESAIILLVRDHGCTNIRIHGTDSEPTRNRPRPIVASTRPAARFYKQSDSDVLAVCTIIGVKPAAGILNRFNRLSESGVMENCVTIGDMVRAVSMDVLQDMDSAPKPSRCDYPRRCDIAHAQTVARSMSRVLSKLETFDDSARRDLAELCAMLCRALNAESR